MSVTLGILLQIAVSVQAADTIPARTPSPVVIRATAPGNTAPRLSTPTASGATLQLVSEVARIGGGFGQAVATREARYVLRAAAPGVTVISAVVASLGTQQVLSETKQVVVEAPPSTVVPAIVSRAPLSRTAPVNFHALTTPDTVWIGEQVTLQVGVFIDDDLRSRLQKNPEYVAPSVEGAVAYDLPVNNDRLPSREQDGARYRPFVFARALFPLRAGPLAIPAARLGYTVASERGMFGRADRLTAVTAPSTVQVRELPVTGRPDAFTGAVGVYSLSARVEKPTGRVGDAVQLTVRIEGVGNIKLLPPPRVEIPGITISPSGEEISVDSTDLLVRGSKTFRFLLTPQRAGDIALGDVAFDYFNPVRGAYEHAAVALGALRVSPGAVVAADASDSVGPSLPLAAWRDAEVRAVGSARWIVGLTVALLAPWLALIVMRVRLRVIAKRERRADRRQSVTLSDDASGVRRRLLIGLGPVIGLRPDQPFAVPEVVRRLRRAGVTNEAAQAAGALLARLDLLTFGTARATEAGVSLGALSKEVDAVLRQVDAERTSDARERMRRTAMLVLCAAALPTIAGAQPEPFRAGTAAYSRRQFTDAAAAFAAAAHGAPRSAAAWTNLGAAQWMRGDTAGAILAWQRSARLSPQSNPSVQLLREYGAASEVRTMLMPLTPETAWLALLVVTGMLSVTGAVWQWRRRRVPNGAIVAGLLIVAACTVLTVLAERARTAERLVVVRRPTALRDEPVLAGEAGARARPGEIGVVEDRRGSWLRIDVGAGRAGWVESEAVRSLALADGAAVADAEQRIATAPALP